MKARLPRGSTITDGQAMVDKLGAILTAGAGVRYNDWAILSAGFIHQDSGLTVPLVAPTVAPGTVTMIFTKSYMKYTQVRFEARSTSGCRTNLTLFGINVDFDAADYEHLRVPASSPVFPTAMWTGLSEVAPAIVAIDGTAVIWYPYYNIKLNDHYLGKLRT
jgi:hypothetical protein